MARSPVKTISVAAAPKAVGGWRAANVARPPSNYQIFAAELRGADATPEGVKRTIGDFSKYASAKWKALSDKAKAVYTNRADALLAEAVPQLMAAKAQLKSAKRAASVKLPEGWAFVKGDSKAIKDRFVHTASGVVVFTKPYAGDAAPFTKRARKATAAAAADDE